MSSPHNASEWLSVREAADLLGLSPDALRKRFASGRLAGAAVDGVIRLSASAIEAERASLLRRLNARDARPDHAPDSAAADSDVATAERDYLRSDLIRARAAAESLAQANAAGLDMARAQLDALQQFLAPSGIDG